MASESTKVRIYGLRTVVNEECAREFGDGRVFTIAEARALVQPRFPGMTITMKEVGQALYRLTTDDDGTSTVKHVGGKRSGTYQIKPGTERPAPTEGESMATIIDNIFNMLVTINARCQRVERIEAKLREMGVRIEP